MLHIHFYHFSKRALTTLYMSVVVERDQVNKNCQKDLLHIKEYCLGLRSPFLAPFSPKKQTGD